MLESWVAWPVLGTALFVYALMTLTLRVMEPKGLSARLGLSPVESADDEEIFSPAEYRSTRIAVTSVRTAAVIAVVISALEGARSVANANSDLWMMIAAAAAVLVCVIVLRTLLNKLADSCEEEVEIWLSPVIWLFVFVARLLRLNRVAGYIYESENGVESSDETEESVLNVLQNIASRDLRASDLMIPLSEVVAVESETALDEIAEMMIKFDLDRILIYGHRVDDILGTISKTTVLKALAQGNGSALAGDASARSDVFGVPVSQQVANLFDDFRGRSDHTAVMLDEDGLVAGILTYDVMLRRLFTNGTADNGSKSDEPVSV